MSGGIKSMIKSVKSYGGLDMNRRSLIFGGVALVAAPAIVRYSSLMPVKTHALTTKISVGEMSNGEWRWASLPLSGGKTRCWWHKNEEGVWVASPSTYLDDMTIECEVKDGVETFRWV